jgi:hypothetical protein
MSKRTKIGEIITKYITFCKEENIPYLGENANIREFRQKYTTDHIVGVVDKYFRPALERGEDALKGYIALEIERMKVLGAMQGYDTNYQVSDKQLEFTVKSITEILSILDA